MSNLNKVDVPVATSGRSKLDLSCDSITSMSFMTPQPVYYRHLIKGEHINLHADAIVRPAPIEVPLFGTIKHNLRYFFVPYRLVFPNWDAFYNDVIASNYSQSSLVSTPPLLPAVEIFNLFFANSYNLVSSSGASVNSYDFFVGNSYYKLTKPGRFVLKILQSLGYELILDSKASFNYNALGLLAFVRVYVDWYSNSQYLNSQDVLSFERLCHYNDPTSHLVLTSADLFNLLSLVGNVIYDTEDYFVNAWDNPVSPVSGQFTSFTFLDPSSNNGTFVGVNSLGSPEMFQGTSSDTSVGTTYLHDALKKLSDFQRRHALAGARSIDRVLAQYGFISDSLKQSRSIYLGFNSSLVDIGSIYATSDGSNGATVSSVGDYAGAAFNKISGDIDYKCDEEGVLIAISTLIPSGHIVQGYDRNNLHVDKYDFFVPEFDSLGVQAIEKGEVYVSTQDTFSANGSLYRGVFGFTGRYGEYKRPRSFLTGDLRYGQFAGNSAWHLNRIFGDGQFGDVSQLVHSLSFTRGSDSVQFNRIFQYTYGDYDAFYSFFKFKIGSYAPCKSLFESYEFSDSGKIVPTENGNKLN